MPSLFAACDEIQGSGNYTYTIGNNEITIEVFNNDEIQDLLTNNLPIGSDNQENIVLIKSDNITVEAGQILSPTSPKKSLVLFCDTLTNNGTISMTGKGPNILPHEYVILQNDTIFNDVIISAYANNQVPRRTVTTGYVNSGISGNNGTNRQCGSGGTGATTANNKSNLEKRLGASGSGYAFGGGAGAGGKSGNTNTVYESSVDVDSSYPMRGAPGFSYNCYGGSGGVGNPSGTGQYNNDYQTGYNRAYQDQNVGVGGRIIIFCNNFINNGNIQANGVAAYTNTLYWSASGGSSGGGAVDIFYRDSCQQGVITANGGAAASLSLNVTSGYVAFGGKGGDGSITVSQLNSEIMDYTDKIQEFNYTGKTQAVTLEPGIYEFYCRGAQGGGEAGSSGGASQARINVLDTKTFYVNVGQQAINRIGGWNEGKTVEETIVNAFGGGGSTDIAISGTDQSSDWNTVLHLNSRIITATGGAGTKGSILSTEIKTGSVKLTKSHMTLVTFTPSASGVNNFNITLSYSTMTLNLLEDGVGVLSWSAITAVWGGYNFKAGKIYSFVADARAFNGTCTFSITYPIYKDAPGGNGSNINYIYTDLTKDSYPISPCNAKAYYMIDPVITANDPTAIGDGYAYIKILRQTLKVPNIVREYFYNGQAQSPELINFASEKIVISDNVKTAAGTYNITLKPLSGYYWEDGTNVTKTLSWIINKADPIVQWPVTNKVLINTPISECIFYDHSGPGTFSWVNSALLSEAPSKLFQAKFTPTDTANYNILYNDILITTFDININNTYNYSGTEEIITLERGVYEVICAGAQGGGLNGQKGSLAKGILPVLQTTDYKYKIGQQALSNIGGWPNGESIDEDLAFGGGGGTLFSELISNLNIIQASGGRGTGLYGPITGYSSATISETSIRGSVGWAGNSYRNPYVAELFVTNPGVVTVSIGGGSYPSSIVPAPPKPDISIQTTGLPASITHRIMVNGTNTQWSSSSWNVTFPTGTIVKHLPDGRALVLDGGPGGGVDYINSLLAETLTTQNTNSGNGYLKIKYLGELIDYPEIKQAYYNTQLQKAEFDNCLDSSVVFTNNWQTNAGSYNITVTPRKGYYWNNATAIAQLYQWIINKINPEVTWPEATSIELSNSISESSLVNGVGAGLFTWTDATQKTNLSLPGYEATFTPTDLTNYNIIKNIISIEIILPDRLNSNIYKNIFPEEVFDFSLIGDIDLTTIISEESVKQENHGFELYDTVYFDGHNYQKAIAENSQKGIVAGIVSKVLDNNTFTLMDSGIIDYVNTEMVDSSFLYLSDTVPGALIQYRDISNKTYIPVAVYIDNKIIVNLQDGSYGDTLVPYQTEEVLFDSYTTEELKSLADSIIAGVE